MSYGIICLLPVAVMLAAAIITKKCISSMIIAVLTGCIIIGGTGWFGTFIDDGLIKIEADTGIVDIFKNTIQSGF